MIIDVLSDVLLLPVAVVCWRHSRLVSAALQLAFVCAMGVRIGIEQMRAVSALTGLAGAIVIGHSDRFDVRAKLGIVLLASMGVDGIALLGHRSGAEWVMPWYQIGALGVMGWIARNNETSNDS